MEEDQAITFTWNKLSSSHPLCALINTAGKVQVIVD